MTEFVVMLPVFIVIFIGLLNIGKLWREGVRVKAKAASETWTEAYDVFGKGSVDQSMPDHMKPDKMGQRGVDWSTHSEVPAGNFRTAVEQKNVGLRDSGTTGEAEDSKEVLSQVGQDQNVPSPPNPSGGMAGKIGDDAQTNSVGTGAGMGAFEDAAEASDSQNDYGGPSPNQNWAAGTRYGLVKGQKSKTMTVGGQTIELKGRYDVMVSPDPVYGPEGGNNPDNLSQDVLTVGMSRLLADKTCMSSVLNIHWDYPAEDFDC